MSLKICEIEKRDRTHVIGVVDTDTGDLYTLKPFPKGDPCQMYDKCVNKDKKCDYCQINKANKVNHFRYYYKDYVPVCPQGWDDCVCDPAYIKATYPEWYKELYGDMTPEKAAKKHCDPTDEYCYDDEDK